MILRTTILKVKVNLPIQVKVNLPTRKMTKMVILPSPTRIQMKKARVVLPSLVMRKVKVNLPVPRVRRNMLEQLLPAPAKYSPSAAALASFIIRTGISPPKASRTRSLSGKPLKAGMLGELRIRPDPESISPATPTPIPTAWPTPGR